MQTFKRIASVALILAFVMNLFPSSTFADESDFVENAVRIDPIASQKQMRGHLDVGEFTGAAIYQYPLTLPLGRNGLTPQVTLTHNSQDETLDSMLGYHWSLDTYSIKRLNKRGVEKFYDGVTQSVGTNDFIAMTPFGSGELVAVNLNDEHHGRYEEKIQSSFARYEYLADNKWVVTDKAGTRYTFGATSETRQFDPSSTQNTYQWMLEEVRDPNGNTIQYTYFKKDNQLYPKEITYGGHEVEADIFQVRFLPFANGNAGPERPDDHYGYEAGFHVATKHLITGVEVMAEGKLRRKYDFTYMTADAYVEHTSIPASLDRQTLYSITETGYDLNDAAITLPPTTFDYTDSVTRWEEVTDNRYPIDWDNKFCHHACESHILTWDMNGDALPDFEMYAPSFGNNNARRLLNNGNGGWTTVQGEWMNGHAVPSFPNFSTKVIDFDGDGFMDIMNSSESSPPGTVGHIISSSLRLVDQGYFNTIPIPMGYYLPLKPDNGASIADLNGDGAPDLIQSRLELQGASSSGAVNIEKKGVCLNETGTGCTLSNLWAPPGFLMIDYDQNIQRDRGGYVQDYNYDGLADFNARTGQGQSLKWLNNGKGGWLPIDSCDTTELNSLYARAFDLNGDGLLDKIDSVHIETHSQSYDQRDLYINTGNELHLFSSRFPVVMGSLNSNNDTSGMGVEILDLNGDGLPDILQSLRIKSTSNSQNPPPDQVTRRIFMQTGSRPYFLKTVHESSGASINLEYKTSPQYLRGDNTLANPKLPIIVTTVSKITTDSGMGDTSEVNYFYEDGQYYFATPQERGFAGFRVVTKTDGLGYKTKTYYHQSETSVQDNSHGEFEDHFSKKGRAYRTEIYDNNGVMIQKTINQWDTRDLGRDRHFFPFLKSTVSILNDANKSTAKAFEYDENGNITTALDYGEVQGNDDGGFNDIGSDLVKTTSTHTQNTIDHLVGWPVEVKRFDQSDTLLTHQRIYYDDLSLGQIEKGNITRQESWLNTESFFISSQAEYNAYGMPVRTIDPNENETLTEYDPLNLYPARVTNALGHTATMIHDIGTGQLLSSIDPNGLATENHYDGLGRLKETWKTHPEGGSMVLASSMIYDDHSMPLMKKAVAHGESADLESYEYKDGFMRPIQTKQTFAEGQFVTTSTFYDERGQVEKQTQPYLTDDSGFTPLSMDQLGNTFTYDTLGRVLTITNPLGTTTNSYKGWKVTTTDALGNMKGFVRDARGNLTEVEEYNNGSVYRTRYNYDELSRLLRMVDNADNVRSLTYDSLGRRLTQSTLNETALWSYTYDANGNMTRRTDPNNQTVHFAYDGLNRMVTEDFMGEAGTELAYSYDTTPNGIGRPSSVMGANYHRTYAYDKWGRTISETKVIRHDTQVNFKTFTFGYTYNRLGGINTLTYPDGTVITYEYDDAHLLSRVRDENVVYAEHFTYSPLGQMTGMRLGNGIEITNTYDENQMYRMTDKVSLLGGNPLQDYHYNYDAIGNITRLTDENSSQTAKTVNYTYDNLSRLISADYTGTANDGDLIQTYEYNSIGNMIRKSDVGLYHYDTPNAHAVTRAGDQTFTYDENGNMVTRNNETMRYDYRNRMTESVGKVRFTYGETYDRLTKTDLETGKTKYYAGKFYEEIDYTQTKYLYAGDYRFAKIDQVIMDDPEDDTPPDEESPPDEETPPDDETPPNDPNPPSQPPVNTGESFGGGGGGGGGGGYGSSDKSALATAIAQGNTQEAQILARRIGKYSPNQSKDTENWVTSNQSASPDEIPKNLRVQAQAKTDVSFKNLRIRYESRKTIITWDAMSDEVVKFQIYRSKQPHPEKLSKHASQLIDDLHPKRSKNTYTDHEINSDEKYVYRVIALNRDNKIIQTSIQLNPDQIFVDTGGTVVDFSPMSTTNFNKIYVSSNNQLSFKRIKESTSLVIIPEEGFTGGTKIKARFLSCTIKNDGGEYCTKLDEQIFDVYAVNVLRKT